MITLSREELKALIKEAIREEFFDVGLRADEAEQVEEARRDFNFLRRLRKTIDASVAKIGWFVIMTVCGGVLIAFWAGVKVKVAGP